MMTKAITGEHETPDGNFDSMPLEPLTIEDLRDFVLMLEHNNCHWDVPGACDGVCDCYLAEILKRIENRWPGTTPLRGRKT